MTENEREQLTTQTAQAASDGDLQFITTGEAAEILRCSDQSIRRYIETGLLCDYRNNPNRGHHKLSREEVENARRFGLPKLGI